MPNEITEMIRGKIPSVSFGGLLGILLAVIGSILFAALLGYLAYRIVMWVRFNKKLVLFRKVGSFIMPVGNDKGMFARIGTAGDIWLKTRKFKKTLPRPKIQMGNNVYWFYEREDGEWINFGLKDFDVQMKEAGAYYVDEDMRLQRLGIQKNLQERLQKVKFWDKYGGMIMSIIFILIITVALVILFREMKGNWSASKEAAQAIYELAKATQNLATSTGGGVVPA